MWRASEGVSARLGIAEFSGHTPRARRCPALTGELAICEPKTLRYRLLHTAAIRDPRVRRP